MHQTIEAAGSSPDSQRGMLKKSQGITRNLPTLYHEEKKGKHNQHWQYTVAEQYEYFPIFLAPTPRRLLSHTRVGAFYILFPSVVL